MTTQATSGDKVRVVIVAPCPVLPLAAASVAQHLNITVKEAERRLCSIPSAICDKITTPKARRLANLLAAIGAQVRIEKSDLPQYPACTLRDVSLQAIEGNRLSELARALTEWLPPIGCRPIERCPATIEAALAGPGGLILERVSQGDVDLLRRVLRRVANLRIAVSDPLRARYDLLPDFRVPFSLPAQLTDMLHQLGIARCKLTGAIAAKLDAPMRDLVLARFPDVPLIVMNRDFQRFDLFLTSTRDVSPRELADFLVTRSDLPHSLLEHLPQPLRIESGLTRENALAFQSDYAALGLETCAKLHLHHPAPCPIADRVNP
ncbi:MAG: hypothetical protein ACK5M4_06740 [Pseudorhodobacter sp.]